MRRLQTLAAAGEVAASMAHEIGSPLNVILGRTRMIGARPDTSEQTRKDLEIVAAQTERITRVVQKLLNISRPSKPKVERVDVSTVVEETLSFVAPECRKRKIEARMQVELDAPTHVLADRDQLMQIMFNLCHNAMQAQPSGGSLDVRIARSPEDIFQRAAVEIDVADAGPGVEPELRGRIFDPFVTTKRSQGGTGLGLAIVDGMVRELGGSVELDHAPKGGACFRVKIPSCDTVPQQSLGAPPQPTIEGA
jgi:signal transduction histidine kinase